MIPLALIVEVGCYNALMSYGAFVELLQLFRKLNVPEVAKYVVRAKTCTDIPSMIFSWRDFVHVMVHRKGAADFCRAVVECTRVLALQCTAIL